MRYLAVVERIEGNIAILKVGPGGYLVKYPLAYLPPVSAGAVLSFEVGINEQAEQQRQKNADELISKLLQMGVIESKVKQEDSDQQPS